VSEIYHKLTRSELTPKNMFYKMYILQQLHAAVPLKYAVSAYMHAVAPLKFGENIFWSIIM